MTRSEPVHFRVYYSMRLQTASLLSCMQVAGFIAGSACSRGEHSQHCLNMSLALLSGIQDRSWAWQATCR